MGGQAVVAGLERLDGCPKALIYGLRKLVTVSGTRRRFRCAPLALQPPVQWRASGTIAHVCVHLQVAHPTLVNELRFGCCGLTDAHIPALTSALSFSESCLTRLDLT